MRIVLYHVLLLVLVFRLSQSRWGYRVYVCNVCVFSVWVCEGADVGVGVCLYVCVCVCVCVLDRGCEHVCEGGWGDCLSGSFYLIK